MDKCTISVIIPLYNMQNYIEDTLLSLEKQTYKNFKIIIVDDGSTDKSSKIIQNYHDKNSLNIEYIYQENQGVSTARNTGLDHCNTDYIYFCDADDMLPYNAFEEIMKYAPFYDIVAGLAIRNFPSNSSQCRNIINTNEGLIYLQKKYLFENSKMQFCSFLYKTKILKKYNIRFSLNLKYGEDEEFAWKYICHCKSSIFLNMPLYYYRINPTSASNQLSFQRVQVIDAMERVVEYYKKEQNNFYFLLHKFGTSRAKLSILRQFAVTENKDLFIKLVKDKKYNYKMRSLLTFHDLKIKISTLLYIISPTLFYRIFKSFKF